MGQEHPQLRFERAPAPRRLPTRSLYAHHDIAEHLLTRPRTLTDRCPFSHGKGQHVGRAIATTKDAVELVDLTIVCQRDRKLGSVEIE